jgi:hypothetical protein
VNFQPLLISHSVLGTHVPFLALAMPPKLQKFTFSGTQALIVVIIQKELLIASTYRLIHSWFTFLIHNRHTSLLISVNSSE